MTNRREAELRALHQRIFRAIGVAPWAPVVGLALVGCATEPGADTAPGAETAPDGAVGADELVQPERRAVDPELLTRSRIQDRGTPVWRPLPQVSGVVTPGHVIEVTLTRVPPGSLVSLFLGHAGGRTDFEGVEVDLGDASLVGEAWAGSDGAAELRFLVPADVPEYTQLGLQAVADDGEGLHHGWVESLIAEEVTPDFPNLTELNPATTDEELVVGERFRACIPQSFYGNCPAPADFHDWQALEIVDYALDRPLRAEISALACQEETAFVGSCCYKVELWDTVNGTAADACIAPVQTGGGGGGGGWGWYEGRPFTAEDGARLAEPCARDDWSDTPAVAPLAASPVRDRIIEAWIAMGRAEHASVASFARFALELVALGAPAELLARATRAQADEIRHARQAFGVASALAGAPVGPGPLPIEGALLRSTDPEAVLVAAIVEGCVNETVSAAQVQEAAGRATDPAIAEILRATAEDELRHAELSWAFVRWMLEQHPELVPVARRAFTGLGVGAAPEADLHASELAAFGVLDPRAEHDVAAHVIERVVVPAAEALLASVEGRAPAVERPAEAEC